ncbi:hypothetical protein [Streptomyces sp. NPDC002516]
MATGLGIRACQPGHRVAFVTAAQWAPLSPRPTRPGSPVLIEPNTAPGRPRGPVSHRVISRTCGDPSIPDAFGTGCSRAMPPPTQRGSPIPRRPEDYWADE